MNTEHDGSGKVKFFDTTLRDGEQAPGYSMNIEEKVRLARQLEKLGVDVIEAGFAIASPGDAASVEAIAKAVEGPVVASLSRALVKDIDAAWAAVKAAKRPRIHTFLATSDLHLARKLKMTREQALARIADAVKYARNLCGDVEFSLEDASRTDPDYMCRAVETAIKAGATTINLPDTVGYATPAEIAAMVGNVIGRVPEAGSATISLHCHNDLGLAVANTLAGLAAGARQAECCIGGIGERAGNAALEEIVMSLRTRRDCYDLDYAIDTKEIAKTAQLLSSITGVKIAPNKPIVGRNAFAHESGIHQHGVMADAKTYEIMTPESVGVKKTALVLGKHSGQHAFSQRLRDLGYSLAKDAEDRLFASFKVLADRKKTIEDRDLVALVDMATGHAAGENDWRLDNYVVSSSNKMFSTACVTLVKAGKTATESAFGTGPVFAAIRAVEKIVKRPFSLDDYQIQAVTERRDALGEVSVKISDSTGTYRGRGVSTDIIEGSILSTLDAINRMLAGSGAALGSGAASCVQRSFEDDDLLRGRTDR
ncbi:MAG: 2-isopropylmalate synthase [Kiritimatiellae bacterium]|nr:2-isopropylmalate synthase [Kiritimatiellia bacterium]